MNPKIFPLRDNALTIEFGNQISAETNDHVLMLARFFDANLFEGLIEIVPAYSSLSVFYDVSLIHRNFPDFPTAFEAIRNFTENALKNLNNLNKTKPRFVEIPVCFDEEYALDLDSVAALHNLSRSEIIRIFLAPVYRVYMLGFLPGFAYLGEVDDRIAAPRKTSPRLKVPKGSVGIAGRQTGIYSLESPGGWQIIGKTNVELFTPEADFPTFFQAGDQVKFRAVKF